MCVTNSESHQASNIQNQHTIISLKWENNKK